MDRGLHSSADAAEEHAAAAVAEPGPGATSGMRFAYVHDPEGNLIELIETAAD